MRRDGRGETMPELPEVETVRRGLAPVMEGAVIVRADVRRPDLRFSLPPDMAPRLTGARVTQLRRRSKYVLADLSTGETLLVHLGMSGRLMVTGAQIGTFHHAHRALEKHDHVVLEMDTGARITFNDPRRFGAMDLFATNRAEDHWLLRDIGPEPFGNAFDETYLTGRMAGRAMPVKAALLDQRTVAGLGNIYVCETLFRAGIDPRRKSGAISKARVASLVPIVRQVLQDAIDAGGSSLRDYRQADGELGYFQHSFDVYDREGAPCRRGGCSGTIRRIVQSGRSTYFCPTCQR
jgi:formamidopyrimidine-DNA glycosylase